MTAASTLANSLAPAAAALPQIDKIFWNGRHSIYGYSSPLGKLPRAALKNLVSLGWREVDSSDANAVPAFAWTSRKAADFPAAGLQLPLVRFLPQACTANVDDKVLLADLLSRHGLLDELCPPTFADLQTFAKDELPSAADRDLWFVKHKHGVKGRAVEPMRTPALSNWLSKQSPSRRDFAIQRAVNPPALWDGRKFACRAHALIACKGESDASPLPMAWLHKDVIVTPHAAEYSEESDEKSVHVSNHGKHHPKPSLTTELPNGHPAHHDTLWPQLVSLASRCLHAARGELLPSPRCATSTLFSLLALDLTLDSNGKPWLLEINSHCTLGEASGTMVDVDPEVYTRLVGDVVRLLVLPAIEEQDHGAGRGLSAWPEGEAAGGFERLEW